MKRLFLTISVVFLAASAGLSAQAGENVLGFQAWKTSRIDEAKQVVDRFNGPDRDDDSSQKRPSKSKSANNRHQTQSKNSRTDQKLQQAQINLEIAQEFTVNDYFVLYLSQFKQKEAFVEAARKLSHDEAAELMMSYQKRLVSGENEGVTASLSGLSTIK